MRAPWRGLASCCLFATLLLAACGNPGPAEHEPDGAEPASLVMPATHAPAPGAKAEAVLGRSVGPAVTPEPVTTEPASPSASPGAAPLPASATPLEAEPSSAVPAPAIEGEAGEPPSILENNQLIVYYGTPLAAGLGVLGMYHPAEAATVVAEHAARYDELNGELGAVGTLDVIYGIAQAEPTENGRYISYLDDATVQEYVRLAEERDLQLMLDLQIGRGQILDEVRRIERYLTNPRVHVAIDPEYAVGPDGVPIETAGRISGQEINAVQEYLRGLCEQYGLPPKVFVLHQYMEETVVEGEAVVLDDDRVELVVNMDAFGDIEEKQRKYEHFARKPYAEKPGFNIFLEHDHQLMSETDVLELSPAASVVFYQ